MTVATTTPAQGRPDFLSKKRIGLAVCLGMIVLVVLRGTSELALMRESGSDAQMPIWIMFLLAKLVYGVFAGGVVAGVLFFEKLRWRIIMGVILLLGWTYAIRMESWKTQLSQQYLAEAKNPTTSSVRLGQLFQFPGTQDSGYELDNRIASNPQATPELLRQLYGRHNLGTLMILARRPDTPEDILQAMIDHDLTRVNQGSENEWIRKSLKLNPKLPEAIRRKLDQHVQPVTE